MFKKIYIISFIAYYIFAFDLFAKDTIIVSVPPQKYFIEQIAKDNFNIKSMMDDDSILPGFMPTGQQYVWTENAIAYFKIGMFDEKDWIDTIRIKNKNIHTFDTTINTTKKELQPYSWLDPMIVRKQAKNILNALTQLDSKNKKFYRDNYFKFVNKLSSLDCQLRTIFKKKKKYYKNNFMVFNPVWNYFSKRYKLTQLVIEASPFSDKQENIMKVLNDVNKYSSNILFIPKYYVPKKLVKSIDSNSKVVIVEFSYLEYDWKTNLLNFAKLISYQPR